MLKLNYLNQKLKQNNHNNNLNNNHNNNHNYNFNVKWFMINYHLIKKESVHFVLKIDLNI